MHSNKHCSFLGTAASSIACCGYCCTLHQASFFITLLHWISASIACFWLLHFISVNIALFCMAAEYCSNAMSVWLHSIVALHLSKHCLFFGIGHRCIQFSNSCLFFGWLHDIATSIALMHCLPASVALLCWLHSIATNLVCTALLIAFQRRLFLSWHCCIPFQQA